MKKGLIICIISVCVLALFACAFIPASADVTETKPVSATDNALKARFLNMLNRNFAYNEDFTSIGLIVEDSVLSLLDRRVPDDNDYIEEAVVKGFIYDMYGIEVLKIEEDTAMHKDGFVYIAPRGFTAYSHEITEITENEDGSFTVLSSVTVNPHDNDAFTTTAKTLFVKNEKSAFGYNIICSDLKGVANGI